MGRKIKSKKFHRNRNKEKHLRPGGGRHSYDSRKKGKSGRNFLSIIKPDEVRLGTGAARLLEGIGVPEPMPFTPDPFQLQALEAIEESDVIVTAPTGSGKTWIAKEGIRKLLAEGRRAWYTTPLKALTNSKYIEFCEEFGEDRVGILTGDRKINPNAPLIVGTTEIYRNQLFDALRSGSSVEVDLVVLDEAHYISDDERGHVWEEAIILTPSRIRLLLLSATIGRVDLLAKWMQDVRGVTVKVIDRSGSRPVELRAAYLSLNMKFLPLYDERGNFNREIK
ncbi:MAG TPA: DEAD/DEAH box helicase [Pyrinomonadaceae bacterium]|nr:DEAD/DEAH box helicase [Pyrinomonadaceae bacterium]